MNKRKITFEIAYKRIKEKYPYLTLLEFISNNEEAIFLDEEYGKFIAKSFRSVYRGTKNHPNRAKKNKIKKFKTTCLEKYGVENPQQNKNIKENTNKTNIKKYGSASPSKNKEIKEKTKKTNLEKYGCEAPAQNKKIQEKIKQTNLKKYGVEYTLQNKIVQEKIKKTNLEKYGVKYAIGSKEVKKIISSSIKNKYAVDHISKLDYIKEKKKNTVFKKYGVEYTLQDKNIREQIKQTNLKKYGVENPQQNKEIKYKTQQTNLKKYSCKNPFSNKTIQDKIKQTNLKKYNTTVPSKNKLIKEKIKQTNLKNGYWHNINGQSLLGYYFNSNLPITYTALNKNYRKYGNRSLNKNHYNIMHGKSKIANLWLSKIEEKLGYKLIREYHIPTTLYHADGYDSKTNTIYEFNGDFWHGNLDKFAATDIHPIKKKTYQEVYNDTIRKENKIKSLGYNLIYIWENDFNLS